MLDRDAYDVAVDRHRDLRVTDTHHVPVVEPLRGRDRRTVTADRLPGIGGLDEQVRLGQSQPGHRSAAADSFQLDGRLGPAERDRKLARRDRSCAVRLDDGDRAGQIFSSQRTTNGSGSCPATTTSW